MKLYEDRPLFVRDGRRKYRITAPFDTVLFAYDVLRRRDISQRDKIILCSDLLVAHPPHALHKRERLLHAAFLLLEGDDREKRSDGPPVMDFAQDAPFIRAAFLQQYGIDLDAERGRMSWLRFVGLLGCLTDATMLIQIVHIRMRPMPAATRSNAEERRALAEAKTRFAIRENEDTSMRRLARQMNAIADNLKAKAGDGR